MAATSTRIAFAVVAEGRIRHGDGTWRERAPEIVGGPYATEAQARAVLAEYGPRLLDLNERVAVRRVAL